MAGAVGFDDGECAALGVETELPTTLVREVMMSTAKWEKIPYVGASAVAPVTDVVRGAMFEPDTAPADGACLVHNS